ncbi:MAG: hypothetical protein ACD_79C01405G0007 [uncultured bacterium]|nr:MAG: hypothetical protein ACD_79C01405G0007 [uncultured bacterium]
MIWTKSDIRYARKIMLVPILIKKGYSLRKLENDNFLIENKFGKLIVKNNYWFRADSKESGNAIDFFIYIEKLTFSDAMKILMPKNC